MVPAIVFFMIVWRVLYRGAKSPIIRDMGGFVARLNMPGWLLPRPSDHGYGALAMIVESMLVPKMAVVLGFVYPNARISLGLSAGIAGSRFSKTFRSVLRWNFLLGVYTTGDCTVNSLHPISPVE